MIRHSLTELRRSNALSLALLVTAISVAALASNVHYWHLQWGRFTYGQSSNLFALLPITLAGGAMLGRRERRTRADELIAGTARPRWQRTAPPAVALAAALLVAHFLILAIGAIVVSRSHSYVSGHILLTPVADAPILFGGAWLGYAAGRAWSSPLVPPVLAAAALVLQLGLSFTEAPGKLTWIDNLILVVQPPGYDWETVTSNALLGHLVLGLGFAISGFLLAAATQWPARVAALVVFVVGIVGAAYLPGVGETGSYGRYAVDPAAQRLVCSAGTPEVCVTAVHSRALAQATDRGRQALQMLSKLPGAPRRAVEWRAEKVLDYSADTGPAVVGVDSGSVAVPAGTVTFKVDDETGEPFPQMVQQLVWGGGAPDRCTGNKDDDTAAKAAAAAWVMGTESVDTDNMPQQSPNFGAQVRDTVRKLRQLPTEEQSRRVAAMRDAAAACRSDLLPILTGAAHK